MPGPCDGCKEQIAQLQRSQEKMHEDNQEVIHEQWGRIGKVELAMWGDGTMRDRGLQGIVADLLTSSQSNNRWLKCIFALLLAVLGAVIGHYWHK